MGHYTSIGGGFRSIMEIKGATSWPQGSRAESTASTRRSTESPLKDQPADDAQHITELEGVRAWPQEPRGRHDLAERGCDCRVDTTEERSPRRAASILEPRDPDRVDAAGRLRPTASPDGGVALGLLLPRPSGDIDLALAQGSLQSVEGAEGRTLAGFPSYQSRLGRECKGLPHRCVFEFDVVCVVLPTVFLSATT